MAAQEGFLLLGLFVKNIVYVNPSTPTFEFAFAFAAVIHAHSLEEIQLPDAWLTIGIFDGLHRGHLALLQPFIDDAHAVGAPAVVVTFSPHPAVVLAGMKEFKYLTTPDELLPLLESTGLDAVITLTFDRKFANQTAEDFMRVVSRTLHLRHLHIGHDTALGRGREGDATRLTELGRSLGYTVTSVPPLKDGGMVISSTRIRKCLSIGQVSTAAQLLGRNYDLYGPVVHGDGRGHLLDIPTANIQVPPEKMIPANGIYACWAWLLASAESEKTPAAVNIGVRPTFTPDLPAPAVEAHLLDFHRDLYGQSVRLEFVEFLRPELKFNSIPALVEQIQSDIHQTRNILR
jgi:riboflavin kinase/FMN adenylyltransferase